MLAGGDLPADDVHDLVIGSGIGDAVTASRLAQSASRRVLLLERDEDLRPGDSPRSARGADARGASR